MLKKILYFLSILCLMFFISNIALASDIVMDLNTNTESESTDNTIYSGDEIIPNADLGISVTNDYDAESSDELSISNMIIIILIVVGIVLILLGIAIILKLK